MFITYYRLFILAYLIIANTMSVAADLSSLAVQTPAFRPVGARDEVAI
jgi:hypothetical protein